MVIRASRKRSSSGRDNLFAFWQLRAGGRVIDHFSNVRGVITNPFDGTAVKYGSAVMSGTFSSAPDADVLDTAVTTLS
jgi:hypothetical protein